MKIDPRQTAKAFCDAVTVRKAARLGLPAVSGHSGAGTAALDPHWQGFPANIAGDCHRVLALSASSLPPRLTNLYEQLNISRSKGVRVVRELAHAGLARVHEFATGSRGGRIKVLEVTDAGWDMLADCDVTRPKKLTHGGWEHELIGAALASVGKTEGQSVEHEITVGNVRIDVVWKNRKGDMAFFQIGVSSPEREVENILKAFSVPVIQSSGLVLVCRDKAFCESVKKLLKQRDQSGTVGEKLVLRLAGEVLKLAYETKGTGK